MPTVAEQIRLKERDKIIMNLYKANYDYKLMAKVVEISEEDLKKVIETNLNKKD